jgi:mono/diheme cytochrome c family protein
MTTRANRATILLALASLAFQSAFCNLPSAIAADPPSFRNDIAPLLAKNCLACHGAQKSSGGWRADTFAKLMKAGPAGPSVTPGKPEESTLFTLLVTADAQARMPKKSDPLPAADVEVIKRWIAAGAPFDGPDRAVEITALLPASANPDPPAVYRTPVPVMAVAFGPDGSEIAAGGYHEVTVWDAATGKLRRRIKNVGQRVHGLAFAPDGSFLAVASGTPGEYGELKLFDPKTGKALRTPGTSDDIVLATAVSPDGKLVAFGGADRTVRVYEAETGKELSKTKQFADWINRLAFSRDGTLLAAASQDKMVKVFEPRTGHLVTAYGGHGKKVSAAAFDPAGDTLCTAGEDGRLHLWRPREYAAFDGTAAQMEDRFKKDPPIKFIAGVSGTVTATAVLNGQVITAMSDGSLRVYDLAERKELRKLDGLKDWACCLTVHPATGRVAAGSFDGTVRVWTIADGKPGTTFTAAPGR